MHISLVLEPPTDHLIPKDVFVIKDSFNYV